MTRATILSPTGATAAVVQPKAGESLMVAALNADVRGIEAECGGSMTCATCHVYVSERHAALFAPPTPDETAMLEFVAAERRATSRLSCQLVATASTPDFEVQLPERQVE